MIDAQTLVNNEELDRFEEGVRAFLNNELDAERFQSMRLQQGVYGQRQEGVNMIRVKVPGGALSPDQMVACAEVLEEYSEHDKAHITTRQDIQIHYVPLGKTPAALRHLAKAGLTTREACNNTVRNVTACPLAGVCAREHVDINTHVDGAVRHFLRHPLTQHLPRKFKISFSGCEADCAQGLMHDLAVIAVQRDGRFGFRIMAGGGLGHKPRHAIVVEEFIPEEELLASMEAVITLHNRYSDRKKRAKSRIKFLVDRFGAEGFVEKYREEFARTRTALADADPLRGEWRTGQVLAGYDNAGAPRRVLAQKQKGLHVLPISVPIGDLTAAQMHGIAEIMRAENLDELRTTQDQNLAIINVPTARLAEIRAAVAKLSLGEPKAGDDVVACPGTSTCRLGITSSKTIGTKLAGGPADLRIRASGCHNGCAQPETADIGIYGEGRRLHGKLVPHYQIYIGGDGRSSGASALKGPSVPAARVEQAIASIQQAYQDDAGTQQSFFQWSQAKGKDYFHELVMDQVAVAPEEIGSVLYDHGDAAAFKVQQFGGGECAGAAQETVAANFAEAANERNYRNAFLLQRKYSESIECAREVSRLVGESLLFVAGKPPVAGLEQIAEQIRQSLPQSADLGTKLADLARGLDGQSSDFDEAAYKLLTGEMDQWMTAAARVCQNIDRQLDLSASVPATQQQVTEKKKSADIVDLRAYGCPLHYVKARNELRKRDGGEVLDLLFSAQESAQQASSSLASDGHEILSVNPGVRGGICVRVRKKAG